MVYALCLDRVLFFMCLPAGSAAPSLLATACGMVLDYKFELLGTIPTGIVAVADW